MICTRRTSGWHGNAFTLSLIGYTSTCEIAVRNSDWLYRLFSHVKIKRIDLYKWALWNKILVLCVINRLIIWLVPRAGKMNQIARFLWLATRAGKMEPSYPLGTTRCIPQAKFPQKPYNKSFIDQVCSVKMAGYWPSSFFASLWTSTSSRSINTQKKNLANIQPSWPHTWSITHT